MGNSNYLAITNESNKTLFSKILPGVVNKYWTRISPVSFFLIIRSSNI